MLEKKAKCIDNIAWICQRQINGVRHKKQKSIRYESILENSKLSLLIFLKLVFEWTEGNSVQKTANQLNINTTTVSSWFFIFQKLICKIVNY